MPVGWIFAVAIALLIRDADRQVLQLLLASRKSGVQHRGWVRVAKTEARDSQMGLTTAF